MADVRDAIAGLGYNEVRTYLPTGNVALTAADAPEVIAERIEGRSFRSGGMSTPWCDPAMNCSLSTMASSLRTRWRISATR